MQIRTGTLDKGVFLDLETVDQDDLDRTNLANCLPSWDWHLFSEPADIPDRIRGAHVVVTNKCRLGRRTLADAPDLRLVAVAATGTEVINLEEATERGITVCNIRDYCTAAVVQHTMTLMLNLLTGQPWYWQRVRNGAWSEARQFCLQDRPIREAAGLTFGVIGHGTLGKAVAQAAQALGMTVLVAERKGRPPRPGRLSFDRVLRRADVLSVHCPLTGDTEDLLARAELASMKEGAILINTARGGIVNEQDLADALREGYLGGAGVDTLSTEPPPPDQPLLDADIPNLLLTPHNAWASRGARQAALDQLARVVRAFAAGDPINVVN